MQIYNHGENSKIHLRDQKPASHLKKGEGAGEVASGSEVRSKRSIAGPVGDNKVRERLLVEIEARIKAGEYLTRAAAERLAEKITE